MGKYGGIPVIGQFERLFDLREEEYGARTNKRDPRAARTLRRISFVREVKQSFLIICEGVNTEPDYFNAFRLTSANIKG